MTLAQDTTVGVTIDGFELRVPKGTLIIRAAEQIGIQIPRFCDHPLLDPVGACRQCIVEVEGQRKPIASCTTTVSDGMVVRTQLTSPVAAKAQRGTIELLLINHPLDCPICDKGGECPLQNQAMSNGQADSRFHDVKRTYPKPIAISSQILLDRERCVLCARCTRFSQQVAGDPFIELFERGALEQVSISTDEPFQSYFSGNTVQICPVGALTSAAYRFRARPFDLQSTPTVCEHCASGCSLRVDWRRGRVQRRLAGDDPEVNEEWNCDKGRFAFQYAQSTDRIMKPRVRTEAGELVEVSWPEALERAAQGLRDAGAVGVLPGGRVTLEDAYAYAKFARVALGTNDVDFRARPHSAEEAEFLAARVAGRELAATYQDLDRAATVILAGFEPEEESPIVFLRLRKAARRGGMRVVAIAPWRTNGVRKLSGELIPTAPGAEAAALRNLDRSTVDGSAVILVGERLATSPGALSAAAALAAQTGAKLGWVPRRAGEPGAVQAGLLPGLLPGGRLVSDAAARSLVDSRWGTATPAEAGRDADAILAAAASGELGALLVGGVDPGDFADPGLALQALDRVGFVVSLELRPSAVTERADVILPVAPVVEKAGTFLTWEGRPRPFDTTLNSTGALPDGRVLHALAAELDIDLGLPGVAQARAELAALGATADHPADPAVEPSTVDALRSGEAVLATWRQLLDAGSLQDGEPHLAGTAKTPRVLLSAATAAEIGATPGAELTISSARGSLTLPLAIEAMPDRVVWLPANSPGSAAHHNLGAAGTVVTLTAGGAR
jgi:NADH-quinone oxidoreductase subunit G